LFDVQGYNYKWERYESDHQIFPDRIILGTESIAEDVFENWQLVEKYPWVTGDFLWTSMDYLGEAGIGNALLDNEEKAWPWFNAFCGDIDLCGFKKPQSYYRDVVWGISELEIAVHTPIPEDRKEIVSFWGWPDEMQSWNWEAHEGEQLSVSIYSSCDSVVMELNGKEVGAVDLQDSARLRSHINLEYQPGELKAIGYKNGRQIASKSLTTTGKPHSIRLSADRMKIRAERNDLAYITVEIIDESGLRIPDAILPVHFEISGNGELAGVGNGNPKDIKSFQQPECKTFKGRCLLIVSPRTIEKGEINVLAKSEGMEESEITVLVQELN
jgi:beta-galactosidase